MMLSSKKSGVLRRSKSSLQSLTSLGSDWSSSGSIKPPPSASIAPPPAISSHTVPISRSSSSPFFQGHSDSSLSSQYGAPECEGIHHMMEVSPDAASTLLSVSLLTDSDSMTIVQCLLLVTVALQIPNYIDSILEILELHIHSLPFLIVLGTFPSLYFKKKQHASTTDTAPASSRNFITPSSSLAHIEEYCRNCSRSDLSCESSPPLRVTNSNADGEWGHFAEFEEALVERDVNFTIPPTLTHRASLSTLVEETDEEE